MGALQRDDAAREEMDRPDCDALLLRRTYAQFPLVNRAVSGWRKNYEQFIRPVLRKQGHSRILDIGCGGGDIAVNLYRWALADGLQVTVCGIDPDQRAIDFARAAGRRRGIPESVVEFLPVGSSQLAADGERFDVVLSNHLLHHLTPSELQQLMADTEKLCPAVALHSDIRRSRLALVLFGAATLPLAGTSFIRRDGLVSIRRSFTAEELAQRARPGWEVEAASPYRNLLIWRSESDG
ncbi:methyltransferase domain-containing protein [Glutamicibacter sp.]|uniref:methyltransferase domain-containing protein n=1 Tax=Glutamicibacter sp. TaxID=1931995 RepID=UPI0028BE2A03|nr:methyltransferase domain-containing protein [Glutamicibacter sp.]